MAPARAKDCGWVLTAASLFARTYALVMASVWKENVHAQMAIPAKTALYLMPTISARRRVRIVVSAWTTESASAKWDGKEKRVT